MAAAASALCARISSLSAATSRSARKMAETSSRHCRYVEMRVKRNPCDRDSYEATPPDSSRRLEGKASGAEGERRAEAGRTAGSSMCAGGVERDLRRVAACEGRGARGEGNRSPVCVWAEGSERRSGMGGVREGGEATAVLPSL